MEITKSLLKRYGNIRIEELIDKFKVKTLILTSIISIILISLVSAECMITSKITIDNETYTDDEIKWMIGTLFNRTMQLEKQNTFLAQQNEMLNLSIRKVNMNIRERNQKIKVQYFFLILLSLLLIYCVWRLRSYENEIQDNLRTD